MLIKSINENFDDDYIDPEEPLFHYNDEEKYNRNEDNDYIDPEEPLFHYSHGKSKEDNATSNSGLERFKGTDVKQCEERLYVNNGKILVTPFSRGKSFEVPVEEYDFIVPMRVAHLGSSNKRKPLVCYVQDSNGKRIGTAEMRK